MNPETLNAILTGLFFGIPATFAVIFAAWMILDELTVNAESSARFLAKKGAAK